MRSKITKTIILIVFVVFLGIVKADSVHAIAMGCYYEGSGVSSDYSLSFSIDDTYSPSGISLQKKGEGKISASVINWGSSVRVSTGQPPEPKITLGGIEMEYAGGYNDVWHNETCTKHAIMVEYNSTTLWMSKNKIFLSASSILDGMIAYIRGRSDGGSNIAAIHILDLKASTSNSRSNPGNVSQKSCVCTKSGDENNSNFKATYLISRSLAAGTVSGTIDGRKVSSLTIKNWSNVDSSARSSYTVLNDISNSQDEYCPQNLLFEASKDIIYLSNDSSKALVQEDMISINRVSTDNIVELRCMVDHRSTDTDTEFRKPPYQNPGVNENIVTPLIPDDTIYSCGSGYIEDIPAILPRTISLLFIILQVVVPIVLVIMGTIDLLKAIITVQKDDDIKKGQQTFMKRLFSAIIIFLVFAFLKLAVGIFSSDTNDIISCMNCFLRGTNNCD